MPIQITIEHVEITLTGSEIKEHEQAIKDAAAVAGYSLGDIETIWGKVIEWAEEDWDHPDVGAYADYAQLVQEAAQEADVYLAQPESYESEEDPTSKAIVDFKAAWAALSWDFSEGGTFSDNVTAKAAIMWQHAVEVEHYKLDVVPALKAAIMISKKFMEGKYSCHFNAAKDAEKAFSLFDASDLDGALLDMWEKAVFRSM
ncbi:hypothetical protein [Streptomyces vinaceus]|uniref:hypothetical protein n=1 Tax=Streptomyces vinaceus TaxID=1960 RepID=UPI00380F78C8